MKFILTALLMISVNSSFAMTAANMDADDIPAGYYKPDANSLANAQRLFREFGSAVVCGENDSALNLYIKKTVGENPFRILSISSTDIADIGKAICASIVKP